MQTGRVIHVVSAHAEGEVGDVIVGGVAPPPGATLWEQSRWIARDGALRDLLLNEPRGGVFRHVNLLAPPMDRRADAGFIIMEPTDTPPTTPMGTGCSARMAVLSARGQLSVGDRFTGISLIGSQFHCTLAAETTLVDRPAIIPSLSGRACITGIPQQMLDPADPWPRGYRLSDSWPGTE